jgi:catechol 2,3-dioxygenase-like lactoylglutathione lyase family enzyme
MSRQIAEARLDHASFTVDDIDAAAWFLETALGFRPAFGPVEISAEFARMTGGDRGATRLMQLWDPAGSHRIELICCAEASAPAGEAPAMRARPPFAHVAFTVPDLAAATERATAAGAVPLGEITEFSEGRASYLRAPGGLVVELEELFS